MTLAVWFPGCATSTPDDSAGTTQESVAETSASSQEEGGEETWSMAEVSSATELGSSTTSEDAVTESPSTGGTLSSGAQTEATETGSEVGFANFAEAGAWVAATCGVANCHDNRYPPYLSDTDPELQKVTLRDYIIYRCGGVPMVIPGDPEESALTLLLTGQCDNLLMPFGCIEPYGFGCASREEVAAVQGWLALPDPFL